MTDRDDLPLTRAQTLSLRLRSSLTLHGAPSQCIVGPSVLSSPVSESRETFNFRCSDGYVGQSDLIVQMYVSTVSNEIAFVIRPRKTHAYAKKPPYLRHPLTVVCRVNAARDSNVHTTRPNPKHERSQTERRNGRISPSTFPPNSEDSA